MAIQGDAANACPAALDRHAPNARFAMTEKEKGQTLRRLVLRALSALALIIGLNETCYGQEIQADKAASIPLRARGAHATFEIKILTNPKSTLTYDLHIFCTRNCPTPLQYSEQIDSAGLEGLLSLGDQYMTIWAVGDGSFVRVYSVSDVGIRKVLETTTRGLWPIITNVDGRRAICVGEATAGEMLARPKTKPHGFCPAGGQIFVWDGKSYHPAAIPE